jgi:hypothetical protein
MHKSATKCNETIGKWCKNKHGASKIIDTFETYQDAAAAPSLLDTSTATKAPAQEEAVVAKSLEAPQRRVLLLMLPSV